MDPRHPNHLVGVWQQDRWSNDGARGIVAGVSFNGGRTWRTVVIPGLTLVSGGSYQRTSDPWVAFAPNGTVYVTSVPFNQEEQGGQSAVSVNKSTDGGLSWSNPVLLIQDPSPLIQTDKDSITTDPRRSRFAYAVWEQLEIPPALVGFRGPAQFARTTNGGRTWEPARTIYDPGPNALTINHQILVTPGGTLLDFFTEFRATFGPSGVSSTTSTLSLMRSTDRGQTWNAPLQVTPMLGVPVTDPDNGQPVRTASTPEGVPAEFASVAIDPDNGHLYAVWQDARFSGGQYDSVAFSMSSDGGLTWSTPIAINKTPTNILPADQQAFNPTIRVAADGTLAVSYYDFRNNTPAPGALTDAWIVFCHPTTPTGATNPAQWGHEVRLTTTSFNLEQRR